MHWNCGNVFPTCARARARRAFRDQVGGDTWSTYVRPSRSHLPFYVCRTLIGYTEKIQIWVDIFLLSGADVADGCHSQFEMDRINICGIFETIQVIQDQSMDGRLRRNPIYARILFKYPLAQTVNFKSERYDETRVLTLRTWRISNSLPLKISTFQYAVSPSTCRSHTLSRLNLGKPRFNINFSNTIWRMARSLHISPITAPVWFSSTHNLASFSDVGDSVRPVRGTAYDDAKSSYAPSWNSVRLCLPVA